MTPVRRFWDDARRKVDDYPCRVGDGCEGRVEAAHLAPRVLDVSVVITGNVTVLYVEPDNIIPLCRKHHQAFDAHALSVVEFLSPEEQAHVCLKLGGLVRALRRVSPTQNHQVEEGA